jgi:hypothetical protein
VTLGFPATLALAAIREMAIVHETANIPRDIARFRSDQPIKNIFERAHNPGLRQ